MDILTDAVREFAKTLKDAMPTSMTIGERVYDILGFLRGDEIRVVGCTMVARAKEMSAHLGADDGQYLLDNQQDISASLRRKVVFNFTDWRHPVNLDYFCCVCWSGGRWVHDWRWLYGHGDDGDRVLRRK